MSIKNLVSDPSYLYIDNTSSFRSNISNTGLQDSYSSTSSYLLFNMRRNDGADSTKNCLFAQWYKPSYSQWTIASYQDLGGQSFIDNLASWSGITLPSGSNNTYLCIPFTAGSPIDLSQAYWTSFGNTTWSYSLVAPYASIIESDSGGSGGESGSDFSGIISAIILIPATIIMVCLFKMIFNIFMNRKVRG